MCEAFGCKARRSESAERKFLMAVLADERPGALSSTVLTQTLDAVKNPGKIAPALKLPMFI
jgi:hypothetical protein